MLAAAKKILLIEDSATDSFLIQRVMREYPSFMSHLIVVKNTMLSAITYLKSTESETSLILLDLGLPDTVDGQDSFFQLDRVNENHIPVIALTSIENKALAVELMNLGLKDYICKSDVLFAPEMLGRAIDFAISRNAGTTSSVISLI